MRRSLLCLNLICLTQQSFGAECPKIPNLGKPDRFKEKELRGYNNILKTSVGRGEAILKFLASLAEGVVPTQDIADHYCELVPHPSTSDFTKLVELQLRL